MNSDVQSPARASVFFERRELDALMQLYGRQVAAGAWRDYALDALCDAAVFSVFEHAGERPLYQVEKRPALARKQGQWAVIGRGGMVLKRGHDLAQALRVFETRRFRVVE